MRAKWGQVSGIDNYSFSTPRSKSAKNWSTESVRQHPFHENKKNSHWNFSVSAIIFKIVAFALQESSSSSAVRNYGVKYDTWKTERLLKYEKLPY